MLSTLLTPSLAHVLGSAHRRRCTTAVLAAFAAMGGVVGVGVPALAQTINPVAPVAGGGFSRAAAVNANGTAATGYTDNALSQDNCLRWTNPGGSVALGLLPGGIFNSYGTGIDSTGTIICGYGDSGSSRAFRWTTGGGYQLLPFVSGTGTYSEASGISQNGSVVVGVSGLGSSARAFRWDAAVPPVAQNLGVVSGQSSSSAEAVSGDGTTVVGSSGTRAFRWTSGSGMVDLGALPGQNWAIGEAVNTNGTVITGRYNVGNEFGYRWTQATGMVALPLTSPGSGALRPKAISGDGNIIVGGAVDSVAGFTAFIWTAAGGTQLLSTHLAARGVNLTGWTLSEATGISADGTAMSGNGVYLGNPVGWVVRGLACPSSITAASQIIGDPCAGGTSVFTFGWGVVAPGVQPRWYRNGVQLFDGFQPSGSIISGATTNTLTISNHQPADAGVIEGAVTGQGACEIRTGPLTWAGPLGLTPNVQPVSATVCAGQNPFLFSVPQIAPVNGAPPSSVTYRWQKFVLGPNTYVDLADGPSGNGGTYIGTGTSTFSILNVQPGDTALYRCRFGLLPCGSATLLTSSIALLSVNTPNPTLTINAPQNIETCPGDSDNFFTVTSLSPLPVGTTYQWQAAVPAGSNTFVNISDGPIGPSSFYGQTNTPTLGIYFMGSGISDKYRCIVTTPGPCSGSSISPVATLTLLSTPVLTGPFNVTSCGGNGSINFNVAAVPSASGTIYQWQTSPSLFGNIWTPATNGPIGNGGTIAGADTSTLTINGNFPGGPVRVRCLVTGPCGPSTMSAVASITSYDTPSIALQSSGGPACPSQPQTIFVQLSQGNFGPVSYQWSLNGVPLVEGDPYIGTQTNSLYIDNINLSTGGVYTCGISTACVSLISNDITLTPCVADFNCNGQVQVSDIFAFLQAWFAGNPAANINGTGGLDVGDIFLFLQLWFAGCNPP